MGLTIISKREGTGGAYELQEFTNKVKAAKRIITEIYEDVESMSDEFGGEYGERMGYHSGYRDDYEPSMRRRRY